MLSLASNHIGNTGAIALANSTSLSSLREVDLKLNNFNDVGIHAIQTSRHLASLETMTLEPVRYENDSFDLLAQAFENL